MNPRTAEGLAGASSSRPPAGARFVHRFVELHTERLEEHLRERRRELHRLARLLIESHRDR